MNKTQILEKLCYYDARNPNGVIDEFDGAEIIESHKRQMLKPHAYCSCDNCFYGRDEMAQNMLKSYELLESAANQLQDFEENGYNNHTAMKIYEFLEIK